MASTSGSTNLAISGLASGFDWQSLVTQLIQVERAPETRMRTEQSTIQQKNNAYSSIVTELNVLSNDIDTLKDPTLFGSRTTSVSDSTKATAQAATGTAQGSYAFQITQMATAASVQGGVDSGRQLSATDDVSGLVLSNAGFVNGIQAGTFSVNGKSITISTSDTLQSVFDQINSATSGAVTGSYDAATDTISLNSAAPITLGNTADTSNFLQAAKLFNNGTGSVTSASALGGVKLGGSAASANLTTAISDGGSGAGAFKINGVQINFNASTDSVADILQRINDSNAGVTASYDTINDRFQITNKSTGDVGISMEDVTGNFLAATKLSGAALQRGSNLQYSVNGGGTLTSLSNTITGDSSGITGLSVTALATGSVTVNVSSDTAKIKSAITNFVSEYNRTQSLVDSQTASTTDSTGKVTAGLLTGDPDANNIATTLRHLVTATVSGLSGAVQNLDSLGIASNGTDNTLAISDSTKLDAALANNLNGVQGLFTNATTGLAVGLRKYLDSAVGDNGSLISHQTALTKQSTDIDANIATMERKITADQQTLTDSFVAMETAQAQITQQQQYLTKAFP